MALLCALAALVGLGAAGAQAEARKSDRLRVAVKSVGEGGEVRVVVSGAPSKRVAVEERVSGSWRALLRAHPRRAGRVRERATLATTSGKTFLRARAGRSRSRRVRVDLGPAAGPSPVVEEPAAPTAPTPRAMPVGFNNNSVSQRVATPEQSADLLAAAGADVDRVQIAWERLERTPGEYDFALSDEIYEADIARGVKPLFILAYAPRWASGPDACTGVAGRCLAGPLPEFHDDFARAAAALAERYPQAAGIEVWNEPNHEHFWRPAADPEGYASLLTEAYAAIKAADPSMPVAGVSLAQQGNEGGSIAAPDYLQRVYAAGAAGSMDALSVHAYAGGDPTGQRAVQDVAAIRETRDAHGSPAPIWVTETGASTSGAYALSEAEQAVRLALLDSGLRAAPGVEMVLVHSLLGPPVDPASREAGFGVVRGDLSPKPAYCALAAAWSGSAPC